ncbi:DUF58 domain-containing protein [candidate division KSB1 bacterium]
MNSTAFKNKLRFLDPEILSRISSLELIARSVVEGFVSGLHKSPYKGFSVEFMGYRSYVPGDEPKHIDWKLFARTNRLYVKEFAEETNTTCHILLDISNSMGYASKKINKIEYASYLAASLAFFMVKQRDSVGLYLFDDKISDIVPPKSTMGHLHNILAVLDNLKPGTISDLGKPFHEMADAIKNRGIIIIISDFLDNADEIIDGLKHLSFNSNEVILFQILDPAEADFNFEDIIELEDMETGEKIMIVGEDAKKVYFRNFEEFKEKVRTECALLGIDYNRFTTDMPLDFALFQYLASRVKHM